MVATLNGARVEGQAWFRIDEQNKHLEWGAEGGSSYRGSLHVTGNEHTCTVTVTLHTDHGNSVQINEGITTILNKTQHLIDEGLAPSCY